MKQISTIYISDDLLRGETEDNRIITENNISLLGYEVADKVSTFVNLQTTSSEFILSFIDNMLDNKFRLVGVITSSKFGTSKMLFVRNQDDYKMLVDAGMIVEN